MKSFYHGQYGISYSDLTLNISCYEPRGKMKRQLGRIASLLVLVFLCAHIYGGAAANAQSIVAKWDFGAGKEEGAEVELPYAAEVGVATLTTNFSPSSTVVHYRNEVEEETANDIGFIAESNNGNYFDLNFNTIGFTQLSLFTWARASSLGFTNFTVRSYDGSTYTTRASFSVPRDNTYRNYSVSLTSLSELWQNSAAVLRIVLSGATNPGGNMRFDNITIFGFASPSPTPTNSPTNSPSPSSSPSSSPSTSPSPSPSRSASSSSTPSNSPSPSRTPSPSPSRSPVTPSPTTTPIPLSCTTSMSRLESAVYDSVRNSLFQGIRSTQPVLAPALLGPMKRALCSFVLSNVSLSTDRAARQAAALLPSNARTYYPGAANMPCPDVKAYRELSFGPGAPDDVIKRWLTHNLAQLRSATHWALVVRASPPAYGGAPTIAQVNYLLALAIVVNDESECPSKTVPSFYFSPTPDV